MAKVILNNKEGQVLRVLGNGGHLSVGRLTGKVFCGGSEHLCSRETLDSLRLWLLVTRSVDSHNRTVFFTSAKRGREAFARWDKANTVEKHTPVKPIDARFGVVVPAAR